ncbi:MAG: YgiQ family radical SAM protein, partial [Candidatus Omnitrophica bacterium CG12_big_fil_rev_8_21_14_0_65_42_8]
MNKFLPVSKKDIEERGWDELDVIIITGDAYVDHPAFGAAVIARVLEQAGYKVGIISQPDWKTSDDFLKLGKPKLFFGITAGNMDSILANYTINRSKRKEDDYSPGGKIGLRPNRATIVYANKIRELFPDTPIVLGGIEASLRRLAHYDFWSDAVRRSILLDAKADLLVYGMGEKQIVEIANRLKKGEAVKNLDNICGTVIIKKDISGLKNYFEIPSFEEIEKDKDKFNEAFRLFYLEADPITGKTIVQKHGDRFVIQLPPERPLTRQELDNIYLLDYARMPHPSYDKEGGVPGFETVKNSIISHRGCSGECSFCSLGVHQGRIVQSRNRDSIVKEIENLT